jgi:hypothetical protein
MVFDHVVVGFGADSEPPAVNLPATGYREYLGQAGSDFIGFDI